MSLKIGSLAVDPGKIFNPAKFFDPVRAIRPEQAVREEVPFRINGGRGGLASLPALTSITGAVSRTIENLGNWYDRLKSAKQLNNGKTIAESSSDFEARLAKQLKLRPIAWLNGSKLLKGALHAGAKALDAATGMLGVCQSYAKEKAAGKGLFAGTMYQISSTVLQTSLAAMAGEAALTGLGAAGFGVLLPAAAGTAAFVGIGYLSGRAFEFVKKALKNQFI